MPNPLQRLRNFLFGSREQDNGYYSAAEDPSGGYLADDQRQLYTALLISPA